MKLDKSELLAKIRDLQRELDSLMDMVIELDEAQELQQVKMPEHDNWLDIKQTCQYLGISQTTFYDAIRKGLLPPGFAFGPKTKRWRISEIIAWKAARQEEKERRSKPNFQKQKNGVPYFDLQEFLKARKRKQGR